MSDSNESPNGDPLVRSFDPFAAKHLQTPDELTEDLNQPVDPDADGHVEAQGQARKAASGTTGVEVEPEANDDMNLLGFARNKK